MPRARNEKAAGNPAALSVLGGWGKLTFNARDRRSGEAGKRTHKRSLRAVPLDRMVRRYHAATV